MSEISRRDFVNGVAVSIVAGAAPATWSAGAAVGTPTQDGALYPPGLRGMRGAAPGTFDVAHALRDGQSFAQSGEGATENYDLVIVGAGLGGLAAAHFFLKRRPAARVLILDSLDDFGGHAQRNEFDVLGRKLIGYGGSEALQSPGSLYSDVAKGLLRDIGVDLRRFRTAFDQKLYPDLRLSRGVFFTREAFGRDALVTGDPMRMVADDVPPDRMNARPIAAFIEDFPVSSSSKRQLLEIFTSTRDPLAGRSVDDKNAYLEHISYRDWLVKHWGASEEAANTFQRRPHDFFALGADAIPAAWAAEVGYPGFLGLGLEQGAVAQAEMDEPYIYHFPDGNASLARLLVRKLIPGSAGGSTMEDIVTARFDYGRLDLPSNRVRIRLQSTATRVRNVTGRGSGRVEVDYVSGGRAAKVVSRHVVLAAFHSMAPYIVPELSSAQRAALAGNVRAPLVYVNIVVRNWRPWVTRGVHEVTNVMGFYSRLKLDYPVSLGEYRCPRSPDEPIVLHLVHVPTVDAPGLDQRARFRAGRSQLYERPFADFENAARDELTRMFGGAGFDFDRDVAAITVNRWGHGYSGFENPLYPDNDAPAEAAAARVGGIVFAGSDAGWDAYAHVAFDEAHRAVGEIA